MFEFLGRVSGFLLGQMEETDPSEKQGHTPTHRHTVLVGPHGNRTPGNRAGGGVLTCWISPLTSVYHFLFTEMQTNNVHKHTVTRYHVNTQTQETKTRK